MKKSSTNDAAAKIRSAHHYASDDRRDIEHVAWLLIMLGEHVAEPNADRSDLQWQSLGNHVEYLANQLHRHATSLASSLEDIARAEMRLRKGEAA